MGKCVSSRLMEHGEFSLPVFLLCAQNCSIALRLASQSPCAGCLQTHRRALQQLMLQTLLLLLPWGAGGVVLFETVCGCHHVCCRYPHMASMQKLGQALHSTQIFLLCVCSAQALLGAGLEKVECPSRLLVLPLSMGTEQNKANLCPMWTEFGERGS